MEMKRIMITNTYIPGCSTEFKLSCYEKENSKVSEEVDNEEFKGLENIVESGLADGCKKESSVQIKFSKFILEINFGFFLMTDKL